MLPVIAQLLALHGDNPLCLQVPGIFAEAVGIGIDAGGGKPMTGIEQLDDVVIRGQ